MLMVTIDVRGTFQLWGCSPTPDHLDITIMANDSNPKNRPQGDTPGNRIKDPEDWTTGDERMTGAQASYLKTLCEEAGEAFDPDLTKAEASERIDALQGKTGRGQGGGRDRA